jgi:hypothetical protein
VRTPARCEAEIAPGAASGLRTTPSDLARLAVEVLPAERAWPGFPEQGKRARPARSAAPTSGGRPDFQLVVDSTPVLVYLDLSFRFEIVDGEGRGSTAGDSSLRE